MQFFEIWLIGVGLSMDAFAVSVCRGLTLFRPTAKHYLSVSLWFGGFQAVMPVCGYLLGAGFGRYVDGFDHILACLILSLIGGNMIHEGFAHVPDAPASPEKDGAASAKSGTLSLFLLAVATSIDAFAVGISFGVMGGVSIIQAAALIGMTTALLSSVGLAIGSLFGAKSKSRAEIAGGVILVLIGVKILVEGLVK